MDRVAKFLLVSAVLLCFSPQGNGAKQKRLQGGWGEWSDFSQCSKTCGPGLVTRFRKWIPGPDEPALEVPFTNTQPYSCFKVECPVNGSWTDWGIWNECSVGCGGGVRTRQRHCSNPAPMFNGSYCTGKEKDEEKCNLDACPPQPPNFDLSVCKESTNFTCTNQKMCIPWQQRCDDVPNCSDGSDELGCRRNGYKIGRVHFSNSAASHRPLSFTFAILTTLSTCFFKFFIGGQ